MVTEVERYRGALLGLAVGDALGTTLEFKRPGTFEPVSEIVGGGPYGLKAGQWTDDTSMALCLAESLIECRGFDRIDQLERYVRWWRKGHLSSTGKCFDIGNTTYAALECFHRTGRPCGQTSKYSAGNGSIMRLAPVPMFYANDLDEAIEFAGQSSATTHAAHEPIGACRYMASLIVLALRGASKETILSPPSMDGLPNKIRRVANGSFKIAQPPEIRGTGYVVDSLEAALWAFWNSDDFADGARMAVNLGDDADTTGAVYGQIAGAFYGEGGIPNRWRDIVALRCKIIAYATQLYDSRYVPREVGG